MQHPNPHIPAMRAAHEVRELAAKLKLTDQHVFFNDTWVEYDRRADYLLDADVGVSTHFEHVETAFSFRTRILDYLWAGLPMVLTDGDSFAELIRTEGLGATVPPGDPDALASALHSVLEAPPSRAAVQGVAERFVWDRVAAPLLAFCRSPERAADAGRPPMDPPEAAAHVPAAGPPARPTARNLVQEAAQSLRQQGPWVTALRGGGYLRRLLARTRSEIGHRRPRTAEGGPQD
jgi:hypothetical protein